MYIFEPVIHETIWGGNRISKFYDIKGITTGHLYMINGHKDMPSKVINGPNKGATLDELFDSHKEIWGLSEFEEFPLTIALVDASQNLSIQVHPDEELAELLEGHRINKTESWVFIETPYSGWIYGGCQCDSIDSVEKEVMNGNVENVTAKYPIELFDCVTVESGTLHAMTSGSLVYEIEYGSNFTYRFYDYDRKDSKGNSRELHIEKALKAIQVQKKPKSTKCQWNEWISTGVYEICPLKNVYSYKNTGNEMECITVLEGQAFVNNCEITSGMSFILLPGEELNNIDFKKIIIARIIR